MDLTEEDVLEILKLFERSDFDFLHLEQGGRKITVSKGGYAPAQLAIEPASQTPALVAPFSPAPAAASAAAPSRPDLKAQTVPDGLVAVKAPMMGRFYAAPSPSDPPFVKQGARVEPGATLGLIEVMKVFASVETEIGGLVERILVKDGQSVEHGQALFLIKPAA
jgi:acetyl-CoA carboxylase biotin carboxyl carrier protein